MKPQHVLTIDIGVPVATVWAALTETGAARPWLYGTVTTSSWQPGEVYTQRTPDGPLMIDGEVVEVDEPHRLVLGFRCHWDDAVASEREGRLTYELEERDGGTRLTVSLAGLGPATLASAQESTREIYEGLRASLEEKTRR